MYEVTYDSGLGWWLRCGPVPTALLAWMDVCRVTCQQPGRRWRMALPRVPQEVCCG